MSRLTNLRATGWHRGVGSLGQMLLRTAVLVALAIGHLGVGVAQSETAPIRFRHHPIPFVLENGETLKKHAPETMAGGVAVFDYDADGDLDIFFTNGAEMPGLKKTSSKYWNRLFENDGRGRFTDVTEKAGLMGTGYDTGAAVADYDNDGDEDLFLAGVHRNTLYRNNGGGRFTDVTADAGLAQGDPEHGPLWSVGAAWFDYNKDSHLDLFQVNYLAWDPKTEPNCADYCHPKVYQGTPNRLYRNNGDGTFTDVSAEAGIREHVGKGMGAAVADFDHDGWPDVFVTNDKAFNFLFHNQGDGTFEEIAFDAGVALPAHAAYISGMGADFRDIDNDGRPDIIVVALEHESFPLYRNAGRGAFEEITERSGLMHLAKLMSGYSPGLFDFDNDGWKDLFVSCGHVQSTKLAGAGVLNIELPNAVFRNLGNGKMSSLVEEAGFLQESAKRHRGAAFGDLNGDGRIDAVVTALRDRAEVWMNESPGANRWLDVAVQGTASNRDGIGASIEVSTSSGRQFNHMTKSVGYASSSAGPVHFGLGLHETVDELIVRWPSRRTQRLKGVKTSQVLRLVEPRKAGVE